MVNPRDIAGERTKKKKKKKSPGLPYPKRTLTSRPTKRFAVYRRADWKCSLTTASFEMTNTHCACLPYAAVILTTLPTISL